MDEAKGIDTARVTKKDDSGQPVVDEERPDGARASAPEGTSESPPAAEAPKTGCRVCGRPVGPKGASGVHPACYQKEIGVRWLAGTRHRRRRGVVSHSRQGR